MAGLSATQRTLRYQREQGRLCGIVERYVKAPNMEFGWRKDLFGIIDLIALDPEKGIIGIQSCATNFSTHFKEMLEGDDVYKDTGITKREACIEWLKAGGGLELWGWRKLKKKRGGKMMVWTPRIHIFKLDDFNEDFG